MLRSNLCKTSDEFSNPFLSSSGNFNQTAQTNSENAFTKIYIVERNAFFRECLLKSLASYSLGGIVACASLAELARVQAGHGLSLVVLSVVSLSEEEADAEITLLIDLDPSMRSMVLAKSVDLNDALATLGRGANGYISMTEGLEIFVSALRFVAAGGTYVPLECLLADKKAREASSGPSTVGCITSREMEVIQAVRQGKANKAIAYELNMSEGTVKVHLRNIMKKLRATNRTGVAVKGGELAMAANGPLTKSRRPFSLVS